MHPAASPGQPLGEVELLVSIPRPRRNVLRVGRNYTEHAREFSSSGYDSGTDSHHLPTAPAVFTNRRGHGRDRSRRGAAPAGDQGIEP